MKTELVKWELGILLEKKNDAEANGRQFSYDEDKRVTQLRKHLDDQIDETKPPVNEPPSDTPKETPF